MDAAKLKLFMSENDGWQKTLQVQTGEIPVMKKMLVEIEKMIEAEEENNPSGKLHFDEQLATQENEMTLLNNELETQQQQLAKDCEKNIPYDIDAFCRQDILRERIKAIEKMYIDLKCNFMGYVAAVS
jgi:hypothetical protein